MGSENLTSFASVVPQRQLLYDTVFVTLLHAAVETFISEVHKLLRFWRGPHHFNIVVVLLMAACIFGLCVSERADELLSHSPPPSPLPPLLLHLSSSLISLLVLSVDVKEHVYLL